MSSSSYYSADLDQGIEPVIGQFGGKRFDRVLLLDILEHLKNPDRLLRQCIQLIKPDGYAVVSVPNVANITVRFSLLIRAIQLHRARDSRQDASALLHSKDRAAVSRREWLPDCPGEEHGNAAGTGAGIVAREHLHEDDQPDAGAAATLLPSLFGYQIMFLAQPLPPSNSATAA